MPLLAFWESNPDEVSQTSIEQVVAMAGDGNLKDNSNCCAELREYLTQANTAKLAEYVDYCLSNSFPKSGLVFQDLVNELGRRLDYKVLNGRYQGTVSAIGFDGIWQSPEGHTIVAEVKTTDAYRIPLDTVSSYRQRLLESKEVADPSSILILVGRQDTGELEAQIRGSRHAWDIRVISADSLIKLVELKEGSDDPETGRKIRSLLTPMEFTRLDSLVDVMFTTAKDVEASVIENIVEKSESATPFEPRDAVATPSGWEFTDAAVLDVKRVKVIDALAKKLSAKFIKKSRALYWDAAHEMRVACSISKRYTKGAYPYWYAYHPQWDDFLGDGVQSFFALGCMDLSHAFAIPLDILRKNLSALNTTTTPRSTYWHIHLVEKENGSIALQLPKISRQLSLDEFGISLDEAK
jgi:hypothetical protein